MNTYIDTILYIPSYSTFTSVVKQYAPQMISSNNEINAFARTPAPMNNDSMLVYVRLTQEQKDSVMFFTQQTIPETYTVTEYSYTEEQAVDEMTGETYMETVATPTDVTYPHPFAGEALVEILAQTEYQGKPTADILYGEIFNDSIKLDKYKSVYDFSPVEMIDEESGEITTISKPERFGQLAS